MEIGTGDDPEESAFLNDYILIHAEIVVAVPETGDCHDP